MKLVYFSNISDKTFTFKHEKRHRGKHSKKRSTLLLTVNMEGSQKLKSFVIGKTAKPRRFSNASPNINF